MDLSIVVTSYGAADCLENCLGSLARFAPPLSHEVIVVDNHSPDDSAEVVRARYPQFRLLALAENLGFARATNLAACECAGEFILFLNGDMQATPGAVERMVRYLRERPAAGIAGPKLVGPGGEQQISWGRFPSLGNEALRWLLHRRAAGALGARGPLARLLLPSPKCAWVSGAGLMGRRELLTRLGGGAIFDERFFLYFEDIDLCRRVRQAGAEVHYAPEAEFIHAGGESARRYDALARRAYRESQVKFYRKHFRRPTASLVEAYARWKLRRQAPLDRPKGCAQEDL